MKSIKKQLLEEFSTQVDESYADRDYEEMMDFVHQMRDEGKSEDKIAVELDAKFGRHASRYLSQFAKHQLGSNLDEVAPEGWEGTIKAMKKDKDIDNPWALANWMKNKGYKPHKKESIEEGAENPNPFALKYDTSVDKYLINDIIKDIESRQPDWPAIGFNSEEGTIFFWDETDEDYFDRLSTVLEVEHGIENEKISNVASESITEANNPNDVALQYEDGVDTNYLSNVLNELIDEVGEIGFNGEDRTIFFSEPVDEGLFDILSSELERRGIKTWKIDNSTPSFTHESETDTSVSESDELGRLLRLSGIRK